MFASELARNSTGRRNVRCGCTGSGVGPWEVTKYELLRGEVTARRGGGQQVNDCGEPGHTSLCYTFADREAFKVSLERVAAKMKPSTDYLAVPGPGANVTVEVTIATPDAPFSSAFNRVESFIA